MGDFGGPNPGTVIITCSTRSNIQMNIREIFPSIKCPPTFGYWISENFVYFGLRRVEFTYETHVHILHAEQKQHDEKIGILYFDETKPEGWTEVPVTKFTLQE